MMILAVYSFGCMNYIILITISGIAHLVPIHIAIIHKTAPARIRIIRVSIVAYPIPIVAVKSTHIAIVILTV